MWISDRDCTFLEKSFLRYHLKLQVELEFLLHFYDRNKLILQVEFHGNLYWSGAWSLLKLEKSRIDVSESVWCFGLSSKFKDLGDKIMLGGGAVSAENLTKFEEKCLKSFKGFGYWGLKEKAELENQGSDLPDLL